MAKTILHSVEEKENWQEKTKNPSEKKWEDESASCSTAILSDSTTTDSSTDDEMSLRPTTSSDQVSRSHKRSVKTGVGVHIPHDILKAPIVVQALVRNKISSSAIFAVMHEIVTTSEGDPSKLSLSYASTERYKIEAIQNITEKIAENWTPPAVANIHCDGTLMEASDGVGKVERLPVLLSGIGGTKVLGVIAIRHKSSSFAGSLIADASDELIKIWDCQNSLPGMVFETTSSNTRAQTAACVALQNTISKPLLWFACRHHVGEVVLGHVCDVLKIEVSKSQKFKFFKHSESIFLLLMDCNYVIAFSRQNDWTSKCHYKALDVTINQRIIPSVGIFKEFDCKVTLLEIAWP